MRKIVFITFWLLLLPVVSPGSDDCPLKGKWRSNEKATLEQMEKYGKVTERQRKFFRNNYFGKLIHEYSCTEAVSYYEGTVQRDQYTISHRYGNVLEVHFSKGVVKITLDNDCYFMPLGQLGFSEVFCRVK